MPRNRDLILSKGKSRENECGDDEDGHTSPAMARKAQDAADAREAMARGAGRMLVGRAAVFTLEGEVMARDAVRKLVLRQGGSQPLKRQEPRQKAHEPSAGEIPLLGFKLCHPTMTGLGMRRVNGDGSGRMSFSAAVAERQYPVGVD